MNLNDRPIRQEGEDRFDMGQTIVKKVYDAITDEMLYPLGVALIGEWGCGKSSAINLIIKKLQKNEKNLILEFEPLLEGKTEIIDILEIFCLKLYQVVNDNDIKKTIIDICEFLTMFVPDEINLNIGVGVKYNAKRDIKQYLEKVKKPFNTSFSQQINKLNCELEKRNYKLYIFIDEVDRLKAIHITNLLIFLRILENLTHCVTVVGIDYNQAIKKITCEANLGLSNYDTAKSYLDKFFQIQFKVEINPFKKMEVARAILNSIDKDGKLIHVFNQTEISNEIKKDFLDIINYLYTPRQIKKWLICLKINYSIIAACREEARLPFTAFLAVTIKHPDIIYHMTNHTIYLLRLKFFNRLTDEYIEKEYGIKIEINKSGITEKDLLLTSMGIVVYKQDDKLNQLLAKLLTKITSHPIHDSEVINLVNPIIEHTIPLSFIVLFGEGITDSKKILIYKDFFEEDINRVIRILIEEDEDTLISAELYNYCYRQHLKVATEPSIELINELATKKIFNPNNNENHYKYIIVFLLRNIHVDEMMAQAVLYLSALHFENLLNHFFITPINGAYDLQKRINFDKHDFINWHSSYRNITSLNDFIKEKIKLWLEKVEEFFTKGDDNKKQIALIAVLYCYIQWASSFKKEDASNDPSPQNKLSQLIIKYLTNEQALAFNKAELKKELNRRYRAFKNEGCDKNAFTSLFDNNAELIKLLESEQ